MIRFNLKRSVFAALVLTLAAGTGRFGFAAPVHAAPAAHPARAARPATRPTPARPAAKRIPFQLYATLLKNPPVLGFTPDGSMFRSIYYRVKELHPDNFTDHELYGGVKKEVAELLTEAKVSEAPLKPMAIDDNLPDEVFERYHNQVDERVLWFAMIRGLMKGTADPYSFLLTPEEYRQMMDSLQNQSFAGIGIYIELDPDHHNQLTVLDPIDGTPAARAGLEAGDQIVKIDGKSTDGITADQAAAAIRGPVGKTVVLTIHRTGVLKPRDYPIVRATIEVPLVFRKMLDDGIGYIRLKAFGTNTARDFDEALDYVSQNHARALIIDLRNNGGGFVTAAVDICSHFLPHDDVVVSLKGRREAQAYRANPHALIHLPLVVLVNQYSASASEITAGCLKDYGVATLIGDKTFGKGCAQQLFPLRGGAYLRLTTAYILTPKGIRYHKIGIQPDDRVDLDPRLVGKPGKDLQLHAAVEFLKGKISSAAQ